MPITDRYRVILLDMNSTFMFGEDRFGPEQDFFKTYLQLAGTVLQAEEVDRAIRVCFEAMLALSRDTSQYDNFMTVREGLHKFAGMTDAPDAEIDRLVDVFAVHELGHVPAEYVTFIQGLAKTHELGIVSNIYAPKSRWLQEFDRRGILGAFKKMVFSSDYTSIKPSTILFKEALASFDVDPREVLLAGDSLKRDIQPAKSLECATAWINRSAADCGARPNEADFVIPSLLHLG